MKLEHSFTVPVPPEEAWSVLMDVPRIAPAMPGATLEAVDGDEFRGRVRIKAGPITVSYQGVARLVEVDKSAGRVVVEASGKEPRGSGSVKATITSTLHADGGGHSRVEVVTDLAITGKPAQLGRGLLQDMGGEIIRQFADNLAVEVARGSNPTAAPPDPHETTPSGLAPVASGRSPAQPAAAESASLDLVSTLGPVLLKRAAPVIGAVVVLLLVRRWLRR